MINIELLFLAAIPIFILLVNIKYLFKSTNDNFLESEWFNGLTQLNRSIGASILIPGLILYFFGWSYWALVTIGVFGLDIGSKYFRYMFHHAAWFKSYIFTVLVSTIVMGFAIEKTKEFVFLWVLFIMVIYFVNNKKIINTTFPESPNNEINKDNLLNGQNPPIK